MTTLNVRSGKADANGLQIAYEDMGGITDPPVLLIMGFGAQLTYWPLEFCRSLVDAGNRVIRFDNRDIGLSSKLDGVRVDGSKWARMARHQLGLSSPVPYTLADMANDLLGLCDHLGIEFAHVVGASMGGMIAQIFAAEHPERVMSLGIMFSTTNQPLLPPPRPSALRALISSPGKNPTREQVIDMIVESSIAISSPGYPESDDAVRERATAAYDRSFYPAGVIRQFAAATGTGSLLLYSRRIDKPTVVIHGSADPILRPGNGRAVAKAIKGAELHVIEGMGHDLPPQLMPRLSKLLLDSFAHAGIRRSLIE
jgi:pimeloyl-ACP methyl ester carboxylesterase